MANDKARSDDFKSDMCRLSYAKSLFEASSQDGGKKKFNPTLIFPKAAKLAMEKIVAEVINQKWGPAGLERAKKGLIKSPFLAGDGKEAHNKKSGELHPGMGPDVFFIRPTANEDRPPYVWWHDPKTPETVNNVYSGCYGKAVLNAYAWVNSAGGEGVSFGISKFQKLMEGERLGSDGSGSADADKWHETVADEGPAPEATKKGAGAGGLFGD